MHDPSGCVGVSARPGCSHLGGYAPCICGRRNGKVEFSAIGRELNAAGLERLLERLLEQLKEVPAIGSGAVVLPKLRTDSSDGDESTEPCLVGGRRAADGQVKSGTSSFGHELASTRDTSNCGAGPAGVGFSLAVVAKWSNPPVVRNETTHLTDSQVTRVRTRALLGVVVLSCIAMLGARADCPTPIGGASIPPPPPLRASSASPQEEVRPEDRPPRPEDCSPRMPCVAVVSQTYFYRPEGNAILGWKYSPETRRLRRIAFSAIPPGPNGSPLVSELYWLGITADGRKMFGVGREDRTAAIFDRNFETGSVTYSGIRQFETRLDRDNFMAGLDYGSYLDDDSWLGAYRTKRGREFGVHVHPEH